MAEVVAVTFGAAVVTGLRAAVPVSVPQPPHNEDAVRCQEAERAVSKGRPAPSTTKARPQPSGSRQPGPSSMLPLAAGRFPPPWALVTAGVSEERLSTAWHGPEHPAVSTRTAQLDPNAAAGDSDPPSVRLQAGSSCGREDSNLHLRRDWDLNPARLPFRHARARPSDGSVPARGRGGSSLAAHGNSRPHRRPDER